MIIYQNIEIAISLVFNSPWRKKVEPLNKIIRLEERDSNIEGNQIIEWRRRA